MRLTKPVNRPGGAGFTLPELIIVVVAAGLIGSTASLILSSVNEKSRIALAVNNALSDLRYAQETAMAERQDVQFNVNTGANSYSAVYAATGVAVKSPQNRSAGLTVVLGSGETHGVSISAGNASIVFNPDGIPYTAYPAGADLAGPVTILTLNGSRSVVLQPSGLSDIQ